jgi:hypothetical protein
MGYGALAVRGNGAPAVGLFLVVFYAFVDGD